GTAQRQPPPIVDVQSFYFDFRWNFVRIENNRGKTVPINGYPVADRVGVPFDTGKSNFKIILLWRHSVNVPALHWRRTRTASVCLEWDDFKWNAINLRDFFSKLSFVVQ